LSSADTAPLLVIVAGPNGAGKTTIAAPGPGGLLEIFGLDAAERLNADEEALRLIADGAPPGPDTQLAAARAIDARLAAAIEARRSVLVETVLSSDKYRPLTDRARAQGYRTALVYVALQHYLLSARRVKLRVAAGGHDVPADRLAPRWKRSLENLVWFGARADAVYVLDNSAGASGPALLVAITPEESYADRAFIAVLPQRLRDALEAMLREREKYDESRR
jgi:predicted ABC-type ATPase